MALFLISIIVNIGMWLERFVIVIVSLHRDFLPSSWDMYVPTRWDWATFVGTLGLFFSLLFLFMRVLPMISIFEMRELVEKTRRDRRPPMLKPLEQAVVETRPLPTASWRRPASPSRTT